jgi:hypothetical protein
MNFSLFGYARFGSIGPRAVPKRAKTSKRAYLSGKKKIYHSKIAHSKIKWFLFGTKK